ncbi:hypothetical protein HanIR_Chr12g0584261 [Helianthus annuus]|nr:hypothetical protein HanIR_Chr12g0584261 [Helianthus annuus]
MVTEQGLASYKRSVVPLRRAGFRGWSASHHRSPKKKFRSENLCMMCFVRLFVAVVTAGLLGKKFFDFPFNTLNLVLILIYVSVRTNQEGKSYVVLKSKQENLCLVIQRIKLKIQFENT